MNSLKKLEESMGCNTIRDDHGGGVIYQHVHMDKAEFDEMLRKVEEEYSDLQAENAKLREDVAETALMLGAAWEHCSKLRELCADIYEMAYHEYPSAFEATFADRMRELGVEVDE